MSIERDTTGRSPDEDEQSITAGRRDVTGETGVMPPDARLHTEDPPEALPGPKPKRHIGRYLLVVLMCFLLLLPFVPLIFWSISHRWFFPTIIPDELSDRAWSYVFSERSGVMEGLFNSLAIALLVAVIAATIGLKIHQRGIHGIQVTGQVHHAGDIGITAIAIGDQTDADFGRRLCGSHGAGD